MFSEDIYNIYNVLWYTSVHEIHSLWAGNYQQPQLPSANMADADLDTKLYSLSMQLLSTHSWC